MDIKSYSLYELTQHLQRVIKVNFEEAIWIRAEISECRENTNGHCYMEFIEKDEHTDVIKAKIKATIWANTYRMIKPYFESNTGQSLRAGINVLVAVTIDFHDVYGLSLQVKDIDPNFTIGDLAQKRQATIRQLEADGVMDMNKELELPTPTNRIAIISSATAAGYEDFCNQLEQNAMDFVFYTKLFPAYMQGDQAEQSIIQALDTIHQYAEHFDVVVMIRGGGATTDLSCFDSYELALNCAQFPLPIIAGIGHQRDLSIVDMVAHTSVKTPTAAAAFLIDGMQQAKDKITEVYRKIYLLLDNKLKTQQQYVANISWKLKHSLLQKTSTKKIVLAEHSAALKQAIRLNISKQYNKLELLSKELEHRNPINLLQKGYSITTINGKKLVSTKEVTKGNTIKTYLQDGDISSTVS